MYNDFDIIRRAGIDHQAGYALLRANTTRADDSGGEDDILIIAVTIIAKLQNIHKRTAP